MPDMIVNLYDRPASNRISDVAADGVKIKRALPPDYPQILEFIRKNFDEGWASECTYALYRDPPSCFIAAKDGIIVGFACHDATARGFFGPTGVAENMRGKGIGAALLHRTLDAMQEAGYGYAIIGWVGDALGFYQKEVGATSIENWTPEKSVYSRMYRL